MLESARYRFCRLIFGNHKIFDKWDKPLSGRFYDDTVIKALFVNDDSPSENMFTVYFNYWGPYGPTSFYTERVYKGSKIKTVPIPPEKPGYKFIGWRPGYLISLMSEVLNVSHVKNMKIKGTTSFVAVYEKIEKDDYIVTYSVDKKIYRETVTAGDTLKQVPKLPAKDGGGLLGWRDSDNPGLFTTEYIKNLPIEKDKVFEAVFYQKDGTILPGHLPRPAGYITVTFTPGVAERLEGLTKFHVKKDKPINLYAGEPRVIPFTGYKFTQWNKDLKGIFTVDTVVTAQYNPVSDILPGDVPKPDDYITIIFDKGLGKALEGRDKYYVKKNVAVDLIFGLYLFRIPNHGIKLSLHSYKT